MTSFDEREKGFEAKFAHDADMKFRAEARRNKLLGLWAAGVLGKQGPEAESYVRDVVKADFHESGDGDVFRKLKADLSGHVSDSELRAKMTEMDSVAKAQLTEEF